MLGLKLIPVSKRGPWVLTIYRIATSYVIEQNKSIIAAGVHHQSSFPVEVDWI